VQNFGPASAVSITDTVPRATFVAAIDEGGVVQAHAPGRRWTSTGQQASELKACGAVCVPHAEAAQGIDSTTTVTSSSACSSSTTPRRTKW
jgi:hypothetical protein